MPELKFVVAGKLSNLAADAIVRSLGPDAAEVRRQTVTETSDAERKAVDPISLATLILSIPAAVLAVMDIVDRFRKRRTAQAVIDAAKQAKAEHQVDVYLLALDQAPLPVADLSSDRLLDLVAALPPEAR